MSAKTTKITLYPPTALTERPAPTTTSRRSSTRRKLHGTSGFTLVEILIVLAIIAMAMSVGLPAIDRVTYQQVNSTTRKMVGLVRSVRNDAVLLNLVYRIAFDLEKQTWWVETQKSFQLLQPEAAYDPNKKKKKDEEPPPSNFAPADKYSKKPVKFPNGVEIRGVLKEQTGNIKSGIAYVHFFPNGFAEQAILYLTKEGAETIAYSVIIRPTSGRVEIFPSEITSFDSGEGL